MKALTISKKTQKPFRWKGGFVSSYDYINVVFFFTNQKRTHVIFFISYNVGYYNNKKGRLTKKSSLIFTPPPHCTCKVNWVSHTDRGFSFTLMNKLYTIPIALILLTNGYIYLSLFRFAS